MNYVRTKQAERIARKTFRKYHGHYPEHVSHHEHKLMDVDTCLGIYRKTRVFCSSPWCCGNPRKAEGPTIQERKAPRVDEEWDEL